jgi:hypothetical protein
MTLTRPVSSGFEVDTDAPGDEGPTSRRRVGVASGRFGKRSAGISAVRKTSYAVATTEADFRRAVAMAVVVYGASWDDVVDAANAGRDAFDATEPWTAESLAAACRSDLGEVFDFLDDFGGW